MDISGVGTTANQSASMKQLSGNFNTFLTLLTTQLQNQDPLAPMDANQFTQQLVQFSQVEQQITTNDSLKTLVAMGKSRAAGDTVNYLGKSVTLANGNSVLNDGEAKWTYGLAAKSINTMLSVSDATGKIVYYTPGETSTGAHEFVWDGKDQSGTQLPDGVYKLTVSGKTAAGAHIDSAVASKGTVSQIDFTGSEPLLMIGPMQIRLSDIAAVQGA